jgi:hypothetical protein
MILDPELRAAWKQQATEAHGPVVGAIALCEHAHDTPEHDHAGYQGAEWAKALQACLVAWAATDRDDMAKTAERLFTALIDDLDDIGDHKGGNEAARRDDGYAIRNLGPYTALAYDWLHDRLPAPLRTRARERWKAWLDWYDQKGYRARVPGTNYQAGYLIAATTIAIAQGGDAGADGAALWRHVADDLWGKDMAAAFAKGGVLDGGDWPEGWQYGPLSVAEYALATRIARKAGITVDGVEPWLSSLLRRHVYALSPADGVYPGGDTENEAPNLAPNVLTLDAVAVGESTPDEKRWARSELGRLKITDSNYLLYDSLANTGERPIPLPRPAWPTWYISAATSTVYARTRWDDRAIWFVAECNKALDVDHHHPDAGNFVLSRGKDDVIVDPSPYGTQSTLTSNAPTVASAHLPADYIPSQGFWGVQTGWDWATQRKSGVVAARCDYSDQYKFQERKTDVPDAIRDLVLLPNADGTDATLVVVDRASTTAADRAMFLRFRTPGGLKLDGDNGESVVGGSKLAIAGVARSSGKPLVGVTQLKDCFKAGTIRGKCDAARFSAVDYRVEIAGPEPRAVHALSAIDKGARAPAITAIKGDGWAGVRVSGVRDAVVVWPTEKTGKLAYKVPHGKAVSHVVLDAPAPSGGATITATAAGGDCSVEIAPGGTTPARPAVFTLDDACQLTLDPEAPSAASAIGTKPRGSGNARSARSGCCGAQTTPESSLAMAFVVALVLRRRRQIM